MDNLITIEDSIEKITFELYNANFSSDKQIGLIDEANDYVINQWIGTDLRD